jgi:hypothetical protein
MLSKHKKQELTKLRQERNTSTMTVESFNNVPSTIERTTIQEIRKDIKDLNSTIN